jgi:hypothetical protein
VSLSVLIPYFSQIILNHYSFIKNIKNSETLQYFKISYLGSFYAKNYLTGEVIFGLFWKQQISEQRQKFKAVDVEVVFPSSFPKKILFYRFFVEKKLISSPS